MSGLDPVARLGSAPRAAEPPRLHPPLPSPPLPETATREVLARLTQGSAAWIAARLGRVTASRVADVVGRTRAGYAAARGAYLAQLLAERLSGRPSEAYVTPAMAWGRRHEAGARAAYEFFRGVDLAPCGLLLHPTIAMAGASPDGLVGDDGLIEVKCPTTAVHVELLLKGAIPEKHLLQMQWQMACAGRAWCDYVSFDPRLPEPARLLIRRVSRDDARIAALEREVSEFLAELDAREAFLRAGAAARRDGGVAGRAAGDGAGEALDALPPAPQGAGRRQMARDDGDPPDVGAAPAHAAAPAAAVEVGPRSPGRARDTVDVASVRRKPLTPRQRLALYEAHQGRCCICGNRIIGGRWVDEHIRPLSLGGSNDLDNRAPAHERCAQEKTREDLRRLSKAKAQKRAHLGLKAPKRKIAARLFPAVERIRPNLSPLGPSRLARRLGEDDREPTDGGG